MLITLNKSHMYSEHPVMDHCKCKHRVATPPRALTGTLHHNTTTDSVMDHCKYKHHATATTARDGLSDPLTRKWMEFPTTCFFKDRNWKAASLCMLPHRFYAAAVWSDFVQTASCHCLIITCATYVYSHMSYGTFKTLAMLWKIIFISKHF
jgi:hypothetical protein